MSGLGVGQREIAACDDSRVRVDDLQRCARATGRGHAISQPVRRPTRICLTEDDDGDFVADVKDIFPYDSSEWRDDDGDGIGRNADSIEITGAMFGALVTLIVLVVLASLEIRTTFFNKPKP